MLIDPPGCWFSQHRPQTAGHARQALFLDRDGVIIPDRPYRSDTDDMGLIDGVAELIQVARNAGMAVVVVTNQSGIGRGYFSWSDFAIVNSCMVEMLADAFAPVDAVFAAGWHETAPIGMFADHHKHWRKPAPGMFLEAARWLNIDLAKSYMVGDSESDMAAGRSARVGTGLLLSDLAFENCDPVDGFEPHSVANLRECLRYIEGRTAT